MIALGVMVAVGSMTVLPPQAAARGLAPEMKALQEVALESWPNGQPMFRFIWIPPFESQRVICVRVERTAKGPMLTAKAAFRKTGVLETTTRSISAAEWQELADAREKGFWKYRPQEYPQPVFDGSVWVQEGVVDEERLRLVQHVPEEGPFVELGRRMFQMSGIRLRAPEWWTDIRER